MLNMPSVEDDMDDWYFQGALNDFEDAMDEVEHCVRNDLPIPIDVYVTLEQYGVEINSLINYFEKVNDGEDDFYDTYWGC